MKLKKTKENEIQTSTFRIFFWHIKGLNQLNFCRTADCQPHDESAEPTEFAGEYYHSEETMFDDDLMAIPNDLTPLSGW